LDNLHELVAYLCRSSGRPYSHWKPVDHASQNRRLVPRRKGGEDSHESLARGALILIWIDVKVTILRVETRMGGIAEITEVPTRDSDVLID
jgi:hypothetical protein